MEGIARFSVIALDTPDPAGLARFYSELTGWEISPHDDDANWIELQPDTGPAIAFQLASDHVPPNWPSADQPQQAHLDFDVPDLDAGEAAVLAIGARKAEIQPGRTFRVFLDPAGHPFCLVQA